jgi:HipA-like protein
MRAADIYRNRRLAGRLTETDERTYLFRYDDAYLADDGQAAVSLTLPKTQQEYRSEHLFPFFYSLLSEGANKQRQCQKWRIDENDAFGLLLKTAQFDTIGAVTVKPVHEG